MKPFTSRLLTVVWTLAAALAIWIPARASEANWASAPDRAIIPPMQKIRVITKEADGSESTRTISRGRRVEIELADDENGPRVARVLIKWEDDTMVQLIPIRGSENRYITREVELGADRYGSLADLLFWLNDASLVGAEVVDGEECDIWESSAESGDDRQSLKRAWVTKEGRRPMRVEIEQRRHRLAYDGNLNAEPRLPDDAQQELANELRLAREEAERRGHTP